MLYVKFDGQIPVEASYESEQHARDRLAWEKDGPFMTNYQWKSRHDWNSFEQVKQIARLLSLNTRTTYLAVDEGPNVSPRFDIIEPPKVGDKVSYGFNGDYYPDGEIIKITKTWQITTSTGNRYLRYRNTSTWLRTGGTWALVPGHRNERNPSF